MNQSKRDPKTVRCWIVGGGIGCLAAAIHLIKNAHVPGHHIHFLDVYANAARPNKDCGDFRNGYTAHAGLQPYFHEACVEELLKLIPDTNRPGRSLFEVVQDDSRDAAFLSTARTRIIKVTGSAPETLCLGKMPLNSKDRLDVERIMSTEEDRLDDMSIRQFFDPHFFNSRFWILWSSTFAIQPWHSAIEFRRHLHKYLNRIHELNDSHIFGRVQYTLYDSIIRPIRRYLESQGVKFWGNTHIRSITTELIAGQYTVRELHFNTANSESRIIKIKTSDILIMNVGPVAGAVALGTNSYAPQDLQSLPESTTGDWDVWYKISRVAPIFGNPSNFCARIGESNLVTFTITLTDSPFIEYYTTLTGNQPGSGAFVTLANSNWGITINVPRQPVFLGQPSHVHVIWGYGLCTARDGNFIQKPMYCCTGEEICSELLQHLHAPMGILKTSVTIPCLIPHATAAMVTRRRGDRPDIIPAGTTNIAFVGQFTEVPEETAFSLEYSVKSSQIAVHELMSLSIYASKPKESWLVKAFGFLSRTILKRGDSGRL